MGACPYCNAALSEEVRHSKHPIIVVCPACSNAFKVDFSGATPETELLENYQDIQQLAPEGSISRAFFLALPRTLEDLPVFPEIANRILALINDPETSMDLLASVIREDQVIAMNILKLANSARYSGLHETTDLNSACARLGLKVVANAVQVSANRNLFQSNEPRLREYMTMLWKHAIATAYCAHAIGVTLAYPRSEILFAAGLLHDVGKVAMLNIVATHPLANKLLSMDNTAMKEDITAHHPEGPIVELRQSEELLLEAMQRYHHLIGLHIIQHWQLPPEFSVVAFCHENPDQSPDEAFNILIHIVSLANAIANVEGYGLGASAEEESFLLNHPSTRFLNLSDIKLAGLRVDLEDTLESLFDSLT